MRAWHIKTLKPGFFYSPYELSPVIHQPVSIADGVNHLSTPAICRILGTSLRDKCNTALSEKMVPMRVEGRLTEALGEGEPEEQKEILEDGNWSQAGLSLSEAG